MPYKSTARDPWPTEHPYLNDPLRYAPSSTRHPETRKFFTASGNLARARMSCASEAGNFREDQQPW